VLTDGEKAFHQETASENSRSETELTGTDHRQAGRDAGTVNRNHAVFVLRLCRYSSAVPPYDPLAAAGAVVTAAAEAAGDVSAVAPIEP